MSPAIEIQNIEKRVEDVIPGMKSIVAQTITDLKIDVDAPTKEQLRNLIEKILERVTNYFDIKKAIKLKPFLYDSIAHARAEAFFGFK